MGKQLWVETDERYDNNHPGCVSGILHALANQYWHSNIKKMLPHRKHDGLRHAKRNRSPKTRLHEHDSCKEEKLLDSETSHFLVDQCAKKSSSTNKRSLKARIKAFVSEDNSKEDNRNQAPGFPVRSRLQRTYSIHHLEPSDLGHGKISNEWEHPIICLPGDADAVENLNLPQEKYGKLTETTVSQKLKKAKTLRQNGGSDDQLKEYVDILEILNVNKELFLHILEKRASKKASGTTARLTKSGSFPASYSSHSNIRPGKLKYKQNDIYSLPKREKIADTRAPKLFRSNSADTGRGRMLNQEASVTSLGSIQESDKQVGVALPLNNIKQSTENPVKEGDNESNFHETNGSADDLNSGTFTHHRRISSLSESVERYAQLFKYSSNSESKMQLSRSLKLTNDYEFPSSALPMFYRRVHSLPHVDNYDSIHDQESCDAHYPSVPARNVVDGSKNMGSGGHEELKLLALPVNAEKFVGLESCDINLRGEYSVSSTVDIADLSTAKTDRICEDLNGLPAEEFNYPKELEISTEIESSMHPRTNPVLVAECCLEKVESHEEFEISAGSDCTCNHFNQNESAVSSLNKSDGDFVPQSWSIMSPEKFKTAKKSIKIQRHIKYVEDDPDFTYVREILELSGFITNGFQERWYSPEHPLDPSMFQKLESCYPHEPECFEEELCALSHHLLLFDLVDEVLFQMYERSFTYYPKALSSACHIHPAPMGDYVLEELWGRIVRLLNLKPEMNQNLDFLVSQDFGQDDGWMNLQFESECVALDLENLIFDELLEESFCS